MPEPRTPLPDSRVSPRFGGVCTFCRFPLLEEASKAAGGARAAIDWVLYGVPFDSGVTYRPGARFGPRAIREASQYVKMYSIEHDVNISEVLSMADGGDAPVKPFSLKETLEGVAAHALEMSRTAGGARLFAVGGDHSVAYANMKATWQRIGRPTGGMPLIHFDSHLDTVDRVWGEKWSHASVFIRAIEEGIVDPRRMLSIGVKGPLNSVKDLGYAGAHGVKVLTYDRWRREGAGEIDTFLADLNAARSGGTRPAGAYVTFDIDCIDPAFAPGTGTPSVGGFTSAEVLELLRRLSRGGGGLEVLGADVVEVLPDRDPAGITSFLAAHVIFEILCLDAVRQRGSNRVNGG